jgi:hypothetical protein
MHRPWEPPDSTGRAFASDPARSPGRRYIRGWQVRHGRITCEAEQKTQRSPAESPRAPRQARSQRRHGPRGHHISVTELPCGYRRGAYPAPLSGDARNTLDRTSRLHEHVIVVDAERHVIDYHAAKGAGGIRISVLETKRITCAMCTPQNSLLIFLIAPIAHRSILI